MGISLEKSRWTLGGLALAAGLVSVGAWWAMRRTEALPFPVVQTPNLSEVAAAASTARPASLGRARRAARAGASASCAAQSVAVTMAAQVQERRCATATRTERSGQLSKHEVVANGGSPGWALVVEVIGAQVHRVVWTDAAGQRYGCVAEEGGCGGVSIGGRDPLGTRRIVLEDARLDPLPPPRPKGMRAADMPASMFEVDPALKPIRVSAELATQGGDADDPACDGPTVTLASSRGTVKAFCAAAGNEHGLLPGGGELVGFLGDDGPPLRMQLDPQQRIVRIERGSLACEGSACTGASIETAPESDPEGARSVSFSGTTLMRAGSGGSAESVVLDGRLPMPGR